MRISKFLMISLSAKDLFLVPLLVCAGLTPLGFFVVIMFKSLGVFGLLERVKS